MIVYTISSMHYGTLIAWTGLYKTVEEAKAFIRSEFMEGGGGYEDVGEEFDSFVWKESSNDDGMTWHKACNEDHSEQWEIVSHKLI